MSDLRVIDGELIDTVAYRELVEGLRPPKVSAPLDAIRFRPQPKQRELLKACGVLEWFESNGR